jgi:hypothetical protein
MSIELYNVSHSSSERGVIWINEKGIMMTHGQRTELGLAYHIYVTASNRQIVAATEPEMIRGGLPKVSFGFIKKYMDAFNNKKPISKVNLNQVK